MPTSRRSLYYKGKRAEYQLIEYLRKRGWAVMRAPASGARGKRIHYPDIIAVKKGRTLIFEVKYRSRLDTVFLSEIQYRVLREYAEKTKGEAYVAVKIKGWKWFKVIPLDDLEETERMSRKVYRIPVHKIREAKDIWMIL